MQATNHGEVKKSKNKGRKLTYPKLIIWVVNLDKLAARNNPTVSNLQKDEQQVRKPRDKEDNSFMKFLFIIKCLIIKIIVLLF